MELATITLYYSIFSISIGVYQNNNEGVEGSKETLSEVPQLMHKVGRDPARTRLKEENHQPHVLRELHHISACMKCSRLSFMMPLYVYWLTRSKGDIARAPTTSNVHPSDLVVAVTLGDLCTIEFSDVLGTSATL